MKGMRLFMTVDAVGGVWQYATALAARLATGSGVTVRLAVVGRAPSHDQTAEFDTIPGVDLEHLPVPFDWLAGNRTTLEQARRTIATAADAWGADILHVNQPSYVGGNGTAPIVAFSHSCVETWWRATRGTTAPDNFAWHREAVRDGLAEAAIAVAPSYAFAHMLQRTYQLSVPIHVVHNGLPNSYSLVRKSNTVLAAGRGWDESKNFGVLDAAAARIVWPVRLAGSCETPDGDNAVRFPHLHCLGHLSRQAMVQEFAAAPVFVAPSVHEPFGLAVLEAAQAGAALVLADIPTFRELWSDAALFFAPFDADMLAALVNRLAADPVLRRRQAERARFRAREFGIERTARRMLDLYREAHQQCRPGLEATG